MNTNKIGIPTIFVDADSCPVKTEIVEIAASYSINVLFVASYAHMMNDFTAATWKFVDSTKEAVDLFIMNHVKKGDVAVTQDIGLASTLLPQGVYVLSPKGILYEEETIHTALDLRFLSAKARRQGKHSKGPKPYTVDDRKRFVSELKGILSGIIPETQ